MQGRLNRVWVYGLNPIVIHRVEPDGSFATTGSRRPICTNHPGRYGFQDVTSQVAIKGKMRCSVSVSSGLKRITHCTSTFLYNMGSSVLRDFPMSDQSTLGLFSNRLQCSRIPATRSNPSGTGTSDTEVAGLEGGWSGLPGGE